MTLYDDLGVSESASQEDIKNAFRVKAKEHHPDKSGDPEKMKKVNHAYMILKDPEKRKTYDETGEEVGASQQNRAFKIASEILNGIIQEDPVRVELYLERLKKDMYNHFNGLIKKEKDTIKKYKAMLKRILRTPKEDLFTPSIKSGIIMAEQNIKRIEKDIEINEKAFSYFEGYVFAPNTEEEKSSFTFTMPPLSGAF